MKTITYDPNVGQMYGDWEVESKALSFLKSNQENITVANALFIDAVRVLVKEGKYPHKDVQFKFNDEIIILDSDGLVVRYPEGFCDTMDKFLERLLS